MPRRRKLHILRFAFRGKSSVVPLCPEEIPLGDSSSPHQTHLRWALAGPPFCTVSTDSIVLHVMQRNCWNLKNNQPDL